jgi:hypothetical protein
VYHISADSRFEEEVELTFEHFAELETEMDTSAMTFFRAESIPTVTEGGQEFIFTPMEGGKFAVGGSHCTLVARAPSTFQLKHSALCLPEPGSLLKYESVTLCCALIPMKCEMLDMLLLLCL